MLCCVYTVTEIGAISCIYRRYWNWRSMRVHWVFLFLFNTTSTTRKNTYTSIYITYVHTYMSIPIKSTSTTHKNTHTYMYTYIHVHMHACVQTYMHAYMHTYKTITYTQIIHKRKKDSYTHKKKQTRCGHGWPTDMQGSHVFSDTHGNVFVHAHTPVCGLVSVNPHMYRCEMWPCQTNTCVRVFEHGKGRNGHCDWSFAIPEKSFSIFTDLDHRSGVDSGHRERYIL
jgi:hypothetical protein